MRRGSETPARPPAWAGHQYLSIALVLAAVALYFQFGGALGVPGAFGSVDRLSGTVVFNEWIWLAAIVTGFHVVFGVAGRFAFSTAAFVGVGAYTSHYVTRGGTLGWAAGLAAAVGVAVLLGGAFALLLRRAQHFYFAVATLGLSEVLVLVMRRWERLTGRSSGEIGGTADMWIFDLEIDSRYRQFFVLLVFLGVVLAVVALIQRSPLQRNAVAARDNPTVVETLGIDGSWPGVVLFTLGCAISSAAGSLFVHTRGIGTPETFGLELGIGVFVALILGGLHSMWGGLVGAWFYVYVPLYLERWEEWTQVIWGAVLVLVMVVVPDGLAGVVGRLRAAAGGGPARPRPAPWAPLRRLVPDGPGSPDEAEAPDAARATGPPPAEERT
jgi:branched-chain amino acid transport system permease protein